MGNPGHPRVWRVPLLSIFLRIYCIFWNLKSLLDKVSYNLIYKTYHFLLLNSPFPPDTADYSFDQLFLSILIGKIRPIHSLYISHLTIWGYKTLVLIGISCHWGPPLMLKYHLWVVQFLNMFIKDNAILVIFLRWLCIIKMTISYS